MPGAFFYLIPLPSAPISCRRFAAGKPGWRKRARFARVCGKRFWIVASGFGIRKSHPVFLEKAPGVLWRPCGGSRRRPEWAARGYGSPIAFKLKLGAWHGFKNEMGFVPEFFFSGMKSRHVASQRGAILRLGGGILTFAAPKKFKSRPLRGMCLAAALMRGYFPGFSGLAPRERHMGHMVSRVLQRCARQCSRP